MTKPIPVRDTREGAIFRVRITPRASRTAITGLMGEGDDMTLKIALHAPPVEGRANSALIEFLSDLLKTPRSTIAMVGGEHARNKTILVRGKHGAEIVPVLENAAAAARK